MSKLHYIKSNGIVSIYRTEDTLLPVATFRVGETPDEVADKLSIALNRLKRETACSLEIFNKKGNVRGVVIYGGYWKLNFLSVPTTKCADLFTLKADIEYITLRVCLHYGISEQSVTSYVIRHALRSLFQSKKR